MEEGYLELEGTPDMVLEVVSESSVQKDTKRLRQLYWQAGIREYWLVDARREPDRKSTRLNSSHLVISYAVFCLKKKKRNTYHTRLLHHITHLRAHVPQRYRNPQSEREARILRP